MTLIGITGTHGAGKGTITNHLTEKYGFVSFSVSEFLATEAVRRGLKPDRTARRDIANEYRAQGPTGLMSAVFATIDPALSRVILEPQYTTEEVEFVQSRGGVVIAVDASLETRYRRVHVRGSAKDDVSFEEFKEAQEREMGSENSNQQNLSEAMKRADVHLTNDGTVEEFERGIEAMCRERRLLG
jgi:dephospho-CoA kinase